jgi:hypothetical protein
MSKFEEYLEAVRNSVELSEGKMFSDRDDTIYFSTKEDAEEEIRGSKDVKTIKKYWKPVNKEILDELQLSIDTLNGELHNIIDEYDGEEPLKIGKYIFQWGYGLGGLADL